MPSFVVRKSDPRSDGIARRQSSIASADSDDDTSRSVRHDDIAVSESARQYRSCWRVRLWHSVQLFVDLPATFAPRICSAVSASSSSGSVTGLRSTGRSSGVGGEMPSSFGSVSAGSIGPWHPRTRISTRTRRMAIIKPDRAREREPSRASIDADRRRSCWGRMSVMYGASLCWVWIPHQALRVVRVPVIDLGLDDGGEILAVAALDGPQVIGEEVVADPGRAMVRLAREDRLGGERGAAVLVAADAVGAGVAAALLDVGVRAPARAAGAAGAHGRERVAERAAEAAARIGNRAPLGSWTV